MNRAMLVALMGASALGAVAWLNRAESRHERRRFKKEQLQRWEGEGGSPVAASHPYSDPVGPEPDIASGTGRDPGGTDSSPTR